MANRRLPRVSTTDGRQIKKNLDDEDIIEAKLFNGLNYNSMGIKHRLKIRCDSIELPKMNDRHYNMEKITKDTKEKYFKYSMALKRTREKFLEDVSNLDELWKQLESKENDLKSSMVFFNKFLKQNMTKRERFLENISINQSTKKKYDGDVEELKKNVLEMGRIRQMYREQLLKHSIYYDFLKKVATSGNEFDSVHSLIARIELLYSTVENTAVKYDTDKKQLEFLIHEVERNNTGKIYEIGHLLNEVGILNKTYVSVVERSKKSEKQLNEVRTETNKFFSNWILACEFIHQLYLSMCVRQRKEAVFPKGDFHNQLVHICKSMEMLNDIIHTCGYRKKMEKNSREAN
ncbi:uncharacterized protein LOC123685444 [Harmonia axyridis]|uniref:uncharacterized protein LOC123685444 n=1 Tax=Harmonia axyridis TaxID=115357 RepID=UPI001E2776C8|nr:uncharacterized protein LOC123685444 [Harmonia axyridis]